MKREVERDSGHNGQLWRRRLEVLLGFIDWGSIMNQRVAGSIWGQVQQALCTLSHGDSLHETEQLEE